MRLGLGTEKGKKSSITHSNFQVYGPSKKIMVNYRKGKMQNKRSHQLGNCVYKAVKLLLG